MEKIESFKVFVVANDYKLNEKLMINALEKLEGNVNVQSFHTKESFIEEIDNSDIKPDVVVLDHKLNTVCEDNNKGEYTMDKIKKISPNSCIIIVSEENEMSAAVKALKHGAQDFVLKDRFLFPHISESVKSCLHPPKL